MRAMLLLGLALGLVPGLAAQSLASRIEGVKEGTVRMSFAAREGVCGDGEHSITYGSGRRGEWVGSCAHGPVRVVVQRDGGRTTDIRTYVGGAWRGSGRIASRPWGWRALSRRRGYLPICRCRPTSSSG